VTVVSMFVDVLTLVAVLTLVSFVGVLVRRPRRRSWTDTQTELQQKDHLGWDANRSSGGMFNGPGGM
jgi:hypothetical protein